MEKERFAEQLKRHHLGALNASTRRTSGISAAIRGLTLPTGQFDAARIRLPLEGGDDA